MCDVQEEVEEGKGMPTREGYSDVPVCRPLGAAAVRGEAYGADADVLEARVP